MTGRTVDSPLSDLPSDDGARPTRQPRVGRAKKTRIGAFTRIQNVLLSLIVFALIFDSGGELGLRIYALGLLALTSALRFRGMRLHAMEMLVWVNAFYLLIPSLIASVLKSVPFATILVWTFPILTFPLILAVVRANRVTVDHFINGGLLFSLVILILFYGRLNHIEQISTVYDYLAERSAGFFNEKKVFFDDAMPVVYFQGTLALVICAVLSIGRHRYVAYTIICAALLVAPSRFGLVLSLVFGFSTLCIRHHRSRGFWLIFGLTVAMSIVATFSLPKSFVEIFSSEAEGSRIRLLHVESVMDLVDQKPYVLLFGDGPGTTFFSRGFDDMTDNIEISQLEILRKFGLPFTLALTLFLGSVCWRLLRRRYHSLALSIGAHYMVALSNPVLFSLPATVLLAIAIVTLQSKSSFPCKQLSP